LYCVLFINRFLIALFSYSAFKAASVVIKSVVSLSVVSIGPDPSPRTKPPGAACSTQEDSIHICAYAINQFANSAYRVFVVTGREEHQLARRRRPGCVDGRKHGARGR